MEAEKSAKNSWPSHKPKGPAPALKKIVHELHHAPGLVGGIVEKGFSSSSSSSSGGGGGKPSATPLPRPTVLPFPVARHRSHGPHWAPVGSAPVDAGEDDMEEDMDGTDYDPIASCANPIERKKKKVLDFSRWKEFVRQDDASVPQSKKNEAREVKKSSVISDKKKETLPSATSPSVDMLDSEEMIPRDLMNRSFSAELPTTIESKSIMEKLESEAPRSNNLGSTSAVDDIAARAEQNPDINDVELTEADGHGSSSLMDDIDAENLSRLNQMSVEEREEAQAEIMEKMDPAVIEMLRKRGQNKLRSTKGIESEQNKGPKELASSRPAESGKSASTMVPPGDWISKIESNSSSWKAWSERVEKVRALRFSLDGNVLEIDSAQYAPNGAKPNVGPYNVENVAERDLLRTEGDPAAVGYTINEAVALTRSMIPGQRAIALQLLASVLNKALHNLQQMDNGCHVRKRNPIDNFVDWQAVWAFALGPEPQMALSLRIALDDNHDSVVLACVKAIQSILSFDMNENFFDTSEKVTNKKNTFTAPVFRSRPEIDGGFLRGGYWKYSTKPSNILLTNDQNNEDDENEGKRTIQDDVVVAGQDVAAGLVRMGILPRICYLLEMDPLPALEESLVSIVVAVARHSPTCADAVMKCPNLIQTVVKIFTKQGLVEQYSSQIKAVLLLKVLSQANKQICLDFVKRGVFQQAMWHWYKNVFTLESWIKSGREYCRLTSALMVEQLRLWKVCIQYGFCITYFADFFPAMCLWLSPPTFDKLIGNNILGEFTSITREAYLVLEALAQKLPALHSMEQINKQAIDFSDNAAEAWSWNHVAPMIDLAVSWLSLRDIPYISSLTADLSDVEVTSIACMLWVISAILHMLCTIFDMVAPDIHNEMDKKNTSLPWLPHFVPRIGLKIIKNGFLDFLCSSKYEFEAFPTETGSLARGLCILRQQRNVDVSLSSVSCLQGLVQLALLVDECIQRAKTRNNIQPFTECMLGLPEKILEEGIIKSAQNDISQALTLFMSLVSLERQVLQSAEMFGRGGPAPGIGFGWGSCGGGFWSLNVLLAQRDLQLILSLLNIIPVVFENDRIRVEAIKPVIDGPDDAITLQRINSILGVCMLAGPGNEAALEKAWDYLFQAPVLKYLSSCVNHFLCHMKFFNMFDWQYGEEDYYFFSKILNSHYRERWLSVKRKTISEVDTNGIHKRSHALETIQEEIEPHSVVSRDQSSDALLVEWAYQRLPLPMHWFLSAICIVGDSRKISTCSPTDVLDVAKSGLFFLLGLEVMSSLLCSASKDSLISGVPLVWKLHALSMALHLNMDVLEEERSRNVFQTLQEMYGQRIHQLKCRNMTGKNENFPLALSSETQVSGSQELLNFQTTIHESYSTFVENVVEQFGAISYGDIIYGRQVAVYLHRTVEATVRLAVWNALSNAHVLELLPPIEKCIADAEGYLEPVEDKEEILEAYAKSWTSGGLDRAATRGSISFTLAVHHLSCFMFNTSTSEKLATRNKLAKSLLRSCSQKQHQEAMLLTLIRCGVTLSQEPTYKTEVARRLVLLKEACEGNSSLVAVVEKLKSLV